MRTRSLAVVALFLVSACGASTTSKKLGGEPEDSGAGGSGGASDASSSGGRPGTGGGLASGGAGSGGKGTGGAATGGAATGGAPPLDGAVRDAGDASTPVPDASDAGDASTPVPDASVDGSTASDAGPPVDGSVCCAATTVWSAADGVLPSADCPPWTLTNSTATAPTLNSTGVTFSTTTDGANQYFIQKAPEIAAGAKVQIRFRMQLVSSSASTPSRSGAEVLFAFGPSRKKNFLFIDSGLIFLNSAENTRGPSATVATTDAMHDYVIDVDMGTDAVTVSYDGTPTLGGTLFITATDTTTDYIGWGEGSIYAHGTSVWASMTHDAWVRCD